MDVTSLLADPRRSGIQRVERTLIRLWPDDRLSLCRFDPATGLLRRLPREAAAQLAQADPAGPFPPGAPVDPAETVLCAELFDDTARAAAHAARGAASRWLVYDLLPWLRPDWFPAGPALRLMPFLRALRRVERAYISAASKRDAERHVLRRPCAGPVLPLGADGLELERQRFDPSKRDIVLLGTVERRKNVGAALEAMRLLWAEGHDLRLVVIGRMEPDAVVEAAQMRALAGERRLQVLGPLPDEALRAAMRGARALLFPSGGEGYGLPPVEALHCGIPAIAAADLPSLQALPEAGQLRLQATSVPALAAALRVVADDGAAERLWGGAAGLRLGGWAAFARSVADWVSAPPPAPEPA